MVHERRATGHADTTGMRNLGTTDPRAIAKAAREQKKGPGPL